MKFFNLFKRKNEMISMPANICAKCQKKFTAGLESGKVDTGSLNTYCSHNNVLLAAETKGGVLVDWILLPCHSQERAYELVENVRRELVDVISSVANIGEMH